MVVFMSDPSIEPPSEYSFVKSRMSNQQLQSTAPAAPLIKCKEKTLHCLTQTVKGFSLHLFQWSRQGPFKKAHVLKPSPPL